MDDSLSLLAAARERPDAVAIVATSRVFTYGDVAVPVRRIAAAFAANPAAKAGVAIVANLRVETLYVLYALFELGLPVVLLHPRASTEERRQLVESAGVGVVIDESWTSDTLPPTEASPQATPDDDSPLAILFTSGTTGSPKGVHLSRRAFRAASAASAANLGWTPDDRWLLCMPIAHVGGLSVVVRCLAARRPIVLSPWTGTLAPLLADVDRLRATLVSFVPTMLARIFEEDSAYRFPPHVRALLVGGDAAQPSLLTEAARRGVPVLTTYGLTEACSQVATQRPGEAPSSPTDVGRPLPGVEVRIHDDEIQVRGTTMMTNYFPPGRWADPFVDGGWFPTGDLGRIDERGHLHVTGRRSDRIITGGENVDPLEVERALVACPGIASACVFGMNDGRWGQTVAAAVVASNPARPPALETILAHVTTALASFKQPRSIAFCKAFVLNGTGKVDRARTAKEAVPALVRLR